MAINFNGPKPPPAPKAKVNSGPPASLSFMAKKPAPAPAGMGLLTKAPTPEVDYAAHLGFGPKPAPMVDHLMSADPITGSATIETMTTGMDKTPPVVTFEEQYTTKGPMIPANEVYKVAVGGGQTINLGNYESAKINVTISIPCTKEGLDQAFEFGSNWVSDKIESVVKKAKKGI